MTDNIGDVQLIVEEVVQTQPQPGSATDQLAELAKQRFEQFLEE
jgi:hypothetical protein